jgi:hypothetical protein
MNAPHSGMLAAAKGTDAQPMTGTEVSRMISAIFILTCKLIAPRGDSPRRAIIDIKLTSGLQIHGVSIYQRDGQRWASPPGRPVLGPDGKQAVRAGKPAWDVIVSFANATTKARFSHAVIAAVERDYPQVFGAAPQS